MAYLLNVDDDEDFANTLATVLRKEGHNVQIELDTDDAVQSMENKPPDLAILDVMFPEDASAGFEAQGCSNLNANCHKHQLPSLIWSSGYRRPLVTSNRFSGKTCRF